MANVLADLVREYRQAKDLADRAMSQLSDEDFFRRPAGHVNPIALVVKHLAGNLASRWTDFLTSDGEKPWRNRDFEFVLTPEDTRTNLMAAWARGWQALFTAAAALTDADLDRVVTIRGEPHTALQALLRGVTHAAYHTGQILYLTRLLQPESAWLTIAPGQSGGRRGQYLQAR